jgi:anti-sigma regulatory factor (Ser/Thr protein kinase)
LRGFVHDAFFYSGQNEYIEGMAGFIKDGLDAGEPTLVVVDAEKIALLREALNGDAEHVHFADMAEIGLNPAWIIPAWRDFVAEHAGPGTSLRGIGEPIWPGRTAVELTECHRHEALLNLAFANAESFWLRCPYDTRGLAPEVIEAARHTHPKTIEGGREVPSAHYHGVDAVAAPFDEPLADPPESAEEMAFDLDSLAAVRDLIAARGVEAGLTSSRAEDVVLAVNEIAANSIRHGGGAGHLVIWRDRGTLICEVRDRGRLAEPLAGRVRPDVEQIGGYGLWLANRLCDLVQIRLYATGTVVRMHKHS